ncbi:MAG: hypothetical protein E4H14_15455 [Candidatus Thorarchaeota archaeon]|nr:MAG: hypothetical protein E4H14_15455 [Candidatus Thorarchaeota archaeon]
MYGRGVTLSNIYSDTSRYSRRQVSELEEHALSLVPSTLRIRGEPTEDQELESDSDTLPEQLVTPTITTGHPSTLSSRLTYIPDASPPRPNKAKSEYVSSKGITRRWFYERVPSQDFSKDDELHRVTRPPTVIATISSNIDSKRMRGLELRRLFYTVRFLSRKKNLSKNLSTCCRKISTICAKTLSTELDEQRGFI